MPQLLLHSFRFCVNVYFLILNLDTSDGLYKRKTKMKHCVKKSPIGGWLVVIRVEM